MDLNKLLQEKREAILQLAAKHGACNVRVFGSVKTAITQILPSLEQLEHEIAEETDNLDA